MVKTLFTIDSFITFHPDYSGGDNCGMCGLRNGLKHAVNYDYDSGELLDWRVQKDDGDYLEVPICNHCTDQFEKKVLLEL
jgi:hypothetical protein